MRRKTQPLTESEKMQLLLQKQQQIEGQLQTCQENVDLFETYYMQTSWRTGNVFLGWPICSYNQISEFINRPRAKRSVKPYVQIEAHQKLFSISSISSKPFSIISRINYLATKQLNHNSRPKIFRLGRKRKNKQIKQQKIKYEQSPKVQESISQASQVQQLEDDQIQEFSDQSSEESSSIDQIQESENCKIKLETNIKDEFEKPEVKEENINKSKRITFKLGNQSRTIVLQNDQN